MKTVYMDGVFDLFHVGHVEAIQQCQRLGDRVIIGVVGDQDASNYKRPPIIPEDQRVSVVNNMKGVDKVVCPCPLVIDQQFIREHHIDLVVHGFSNPADEEKQAEFFSVPKKMGIFQPIQYSSSINTTEILEKIRNQV